MKRAQKYINHLKRGKDLLSNKYELNDIIENKYGVRRVITQVFPDGVYMSIIQRDGRLGKSLYYGNSHLLHSENINGQYNRGEKYDKNNIEYNITIASDSLKLRDNGCKKF